MELLLVDDDSIDRELFLNAIQMAGEEHTVVEAEHGEKALAYLNSAQRLPQLIILDLNMPVKDGRETLHDLKNDKRFRRIPVCIMSTSNAPSDISITYDNGANLFLVKPLDFKELTEMLTNLLTLFKKYVTLPPLSTSQR